VVTPIKDLIIVAGAGKGIGFACVEEILDKHPHFYVLAISRNTSKLTLLSNENLFTYKCDFSNLSISNTEEISILLNGFNLKGIVFTAGILEVKPIGEITLEIFNSIYQNNVWSLINLIQIVQPYLNSSTHIVTIGSMGGHTGTLKFSGLSAYSSSKAALSSLTECIAEELKPLGISANCLNIGAVETEMMKTAFPEFKTQIKPENIAKFIIHFTISCKELFNGKVIPVSSTIP
jgi:3-oxoacyl-[acyl-carrier protein] reductase